MWEIHLAYLTVRNNTTGQLPSHNISSKHRVAIKFDRFEITSFQAGKKIKIFINIRSCRKATILKIKPNVQFQVRSLNHNNNISYRITNSDKTQTEQLNVYHHD